MYIYNKIVLLMYVLFHCRYVSEPKAYTISTTVACDATISVSVAEPNTLFLLIYGAPLTLM